MRIENKKYIFYIFIKIMIIFLVIFINVLLPKTNSNNSFFLPSVSVISGADGPTTIYLTDYGWQSILKYSLLAVIVINILVLIVFDGIEFLKNRKYTIKYKVKMILSTVIFTIILSFICIGFKILGFAWVEISILINIIFSTIFFVKFILLKMIKDNNKMIV